MASVHRRRAALALTLALGAVGAAHSTSSGQASAATRVEKIPLTLDDGRTVEAQLRIPDNATRPLPALMLFGGFRNAAKVLDKVHTDRPLVWATFDYPFDPPRKFRFPSSLKYAPQARDAIHGAFDGIGKLYQALAQHRAVDPARITVVGASAGAPFAIVGAARQPIPGVILVQGMGDVPAVIENILYRKYREKYGEWVAGPARWVARWINWYCEIPDIAAQARMLRPSQRALMFTASEDTFIPKPATESLWLALNESGARVERIDLEGLHLGVGDDSARIADILQRAMQWMERQDLL